MAACSQEIVLGRTLGRLRILPAGDLRSGDRSEIKVYCGAPYPHVLGRLRFSVTNLKSPARIVRSEVVDIGKTRGVLKSGRLVALKRFKRLRIYSPQYYRNEPPYKSGWERLREIPSLKRLEISPSRLGSTLNPLKQACPPW